MAREAGVRGGAGEGSKSPAPPLEPLENEEKQMKLSYRKKPRARRDLEQGNSAPRAGGRYSSALVQMNTGSADLVPCKRPGLPLDLLVGVLYPVS